MKKRAAAALILAAVMALSACGGTAASSTAPAESTAEESVKEEASEASSSETPQAEAESPAEAAESTEESAQETPAEAVPEDLSVTVTDMAGREVTLEKPAQRVVALSAADCEIIYALGAGDLLVGRGEYCDYPAEVMDIPAVQSGMETNIEEIIALAPQVLFMSSMAQTEEQVAALEEAGIKVVVSDAQSIEGVYEAINIIGQLLGKAEEAREIVKDMQLSFTELAANAAGDWTETVYFEVSPLEYGLWAAGNNTFMNEIAQMIGLRNAFEDIEGWGEVSEEQVIERNPDYIVTISMYYGEGPTPVEEIMGRAGWENVTAVQNGAILNLVDNELSRPGPRLVDGAQMLFDFVYGEEAADQAA